MNWKKLRRMARRWMRRNRQMMPVLLLALTAVMLFVFLLLVPGEQPAEAMESVQDEYPAFLEALAQSESSGRYDVVNRFGYMGRYQIGRLGLQEAGFMDENGRWTALANSYGVYTQADFLASPDAQEAAIRAYHQRTCHYIKALGLNRYIGKTYCGIEVTRSGLLASCHLVGVSAMEKGLSTGQPMYDGNHVSAAVYMERFAGYDVSSIWLD